MSASIPVTIVDNGNISFRRDSIINDTYKEYKVGIQAIVNDFPMPVSPEMLNWNSDDVNIVYVESETGIIKGVDNGVAFIHGSVDDISNSLKVIVEKPGNRETPIDKDNDIGTWKITQVGGTKREIAPLDNGIKITYTGTSGRGPYLKLAKKIRLWSLPDTIRIRINPGEVPIKGITVSTSASKGGNVNTQVGIPEAGKMNIIDLPTSKWCNTKDMVNFPVYFNFIQLDMSAAVSGKEYTIEIPGIEAVYKDVPVPGSVGKVVTDDNTIVYPNQVCKGYVAYIDIPTSDVYKVRLYNEIGMLVKYFEADVQNHIIYGPTYDIANGNYIVKIEGKQETFTCKLIVE